MLRTFWNNLSKAQKIGFLMLVQLFVVVILVLLVQSFMKEKAYVEMENQSVSEYNIPKNAEEFISENIWIAIRNNVADVSKNDIKDVTIREGTYEETKNDDGTISANFIVDIDSVKQSYIAEYFYGSLEGMNEMEREASATLYCIEEPELVKFPDFHCKANRDFVKPDAISYLLPKEFDGFTADYTYSLSSKSGYAVVVEYDPSESVYMSGRVEAYKTEKMNELKEYLKKAGVDPDAYEYIEKFKIVR